MNAKENQPLSNRPLKYCVWEITLACNARCLHCGSSAGRRRERELDTGEALTLVRSLAEMGCESVTLSGGEPLLRTDWVLIAEAIRSAGMQLEMISNGLVAVEQADAIAEAGFFAVTFSVDGTESTHDRLRGVPGGLERLLDGARALVDRKVRIGAVTQINRLNLSCFGWIHELLVDNGFEGWQVQLTMPHGEARTRRDELCLTPDELPALEQAFMEVKKRSNIFVQAADNLGYMGRHEPTMRGGSPGKAAVYAGCQAGLGVVGITSDGTVRGCLSLPASFDEGNIRERSLEEIWNDEKAFSYNRAFDPQRLESACKECPFAKLCRAGCKSLAFSVSGSVNSNPYCLRRLEEGW